MDFGLGLILSFTDNASAGMNNAIQSLGNLTSIAESASNSMNSLNDTATLMAVNQSATMLGNSLTNAGGRILGFLQNQVNGIQSVGTEFQSLRITLNAMLKDSNKAETALGNLMNFAATTPFEISDLTGIFTTITANGLDAFKTLKGATTGYEESLLGAIGDLMAFRPDVPQMQWSTAIRNAFSGEARSLKKALDINIEDMLGHKWGSTGDIQQDFIDLADAIGVAGMMNNNFENNMQVQMANMKDVFTKLKLAISDTGVFDKLTDSVLNISSALGRIDGDRLDNLANSLGGALQFVLTPVVKLSSALGKLIDNLVDFLGTHPKITKMITALAGISSVLLILSGVTMKLIGSFAGFMIVANNLGSVVTKVSKLFQTGFASMTAKMLPFLAVVGLFALAWKTDFAGIRTNTVQFTKDMSNSFDTASSLVNGSVQSMILGLDSLKNKKDFWSNITIGLMKLYGTFKFVAEAWNDNTLSEESFEKAQELGILPLITDILVLKAHFESFFEGVKSGFSKVNNSIKTFLSKLQVNLDGTFLGNLVDDLTSLFDKLSSGDAQAWYDFGESFAEFATKALLLGASLKGLYSIITKIIVVEKILKIVGDISQSISKFLGLVGKLGGKLKKLADVVRNLHLGSTVSTEVATADSAISGGGSSILTTLSGIKDGIIGVVTSTSAIVWGIIVGVIASVVAYATQHWEDFKSSVISIFTNIKDEALKIWDSFKEGCLRVFNSVKDAVTNIIDSIISFKDSITDLIDALKGNAGFKTFTTALSVIGGIIVNTIIPAFNAIVTIISTSLQEAWNILVTIISSIVNVIGNVVGGIIDVITGIINIITGIISGDGDKILQGFTNIFSGIVTSVSSILSGLWNIIASIFTGILNVIQSILTGIVNVIFGLFKGVASGVGDLLNNMFNNIKGIWTRISTTVDSIVSNMSTNVQNKWNGIKTTITNAIEGAKEAVRRGMQKIKEFFNVRWELPKFKLPHFDVSGKFKLDPPSVPKFKVNWYAEGAVFNKPSVIGVGEAGDEAVMPLKNNTQWIDSLASKISNNMGATQYGSPTIIPSQVSKASESNVLTKSITNNDNSSVTSSTQEHNYGNVDNSVHFEAGSIVIEAKDFSAKEAEKFAMLIMQKIKRKKEIEAMLNYQS